MSDEREFLNAYAALRQARDLITELYYVDGYIRNTAHPRLYGKLASLDLVLRTALRGEGERRKRKLKRWWKIWK